jgi:HD-like signal output (HDOD) protein
MLRVTSDAPVSSTFEELSWSGASRVYRLSPDAEDGLILVVLPFASPASSTLVERFLERSDSLEAVGRPLVLPLLAVGVDEPRSLTLGWADGARVLAREVSGRVFDAEVAQVIFDSLAGLLGDDPPDGLPGWDPPPSHVILLIGPHEPERALGFAVAKRTSELLEPEGTRGGSDAGVPPLPDEPAATDALHHHLVTGESLAALGELFAAVILEGDANAGSAPEGVSWSSGDPASESGGGEVASAGDVEELASSGDVEELASAGDVEELASAVDVEELASSSDAEELASSGDVEELASAVDVEEVASSGDVEELASAVDVEEVASSGDVEELASAVDVEELASSSQAEEPASSGHGLTSSCDVEELVSSGDEEELASTGGVSVPAVAGDANEPAGAGELWRREPSMSGDPVVDPAGRSPRVVASGERALAASNAPAPPKSAAAPSARPPDASRGPVASVPSERPRRPSVPPRSWWQSILRGLGLGGDAAAPAPSPPRAEAPRSAPAAAASRPPASPPEPSATPALPGWRERLAFASEPDRASRALASRVLEDAQADLDARRFVERLASQLISGELDLPIFPDSAQRLDAMLRHGEPRLDEVIPVVEGDPLLARRVLQRASSAAHGRALTDLKQAILRIGLDSLWQVAMSAIVNAPVFRVRGMEDEARTVRRLSMLVSALALELEDDPTSRGERFLAGLLHDIGALQILRVAVAVRGAVPAPESIARAIARHAAGVGLVVARSWAMPEGVQRAIGAHPRPGTRTEIAVRRAQVIAQSVLGPTLLSDTELAQAIAEIPGPAVDVAALRRRAEVWMCEAANALD